MHHSKRIHLIRSKYQVLRWLTDLPRYPTADVSKKASPHWTITGRLHHQNSWRINPGPAKYASTDPDVYRSKSSSYSMQVGRRPMDVDQWTSTNGRRPMVDVSSRRTINSTRNVYFYCKDLVRINLYLKYFI